MSISGAALLVVIAASFLKPLLSTNHSIQFPTVTVYDPSNEPSPWEENDLDLNSGAHYVLTLNLPSPQDTDIDEKRQFDPWGGKRFSSGNSESGRKRQFSPWGGKRLDPESSFQDGDDNLVEDIEVPVNSRTNQGSFSPRNAKRNFHAWGGKRHSNTKRGYLSNGENTFQWWRGKRNFNSWGGKRFVNDVRDAIIMTNKNTKTGSKRQAFNSWGGKRASDSWNDKQAINSWSGKQAIYSEPELRDPNSEDDSLPPSYNAIREGSEINMG